MYSRSCVCHFNGERENLHEAIQGDSEGEQVWLVSSSFFLWSAFMGNLMFLSCLVICAELYWSSCVSSVSPCLMASCQCLSTSSFLSGWSVGVKAEVGMLGQERWRKWSQNRCIKWGCGWKGHSAAKMGKERLKWCQWGYTHTSHPILQRTGVQVFPVINKSTVGSAARHSCASDPDGFYSLTPDIRQDQRKGRGQHAVGAAWAFSVEQGSSWEREHTHSLLVELPLPGRLSHSLTHSQPLPFC